MGRSSRHPRRPGTDAGLRLRLSGFDLQGHRGARGLFPENTLEGFASCAALGLASFEIDIAITRDGIPVLHHDPALNPDLARGLDGAWLGAGPPLIRTLSLDALENYDVGRIRPGSAYAERYPDQAPHDGARIPTLQAVLAAQPDARFNIELKSFPVHPEWTVAPEAMTDAVLDVIDRAGAAGRVTIQSFDWRVPRYLRRVRPDIPRGWLSESATREQTVDAIVAEGGGTWTPFHELFTPRMLERAHAAGLRVIPWTVNDEAEMRRLIAWGVDGLITDRPDRAMRALSA